MSDEQESKERKGPGGLKQGLGILSALKDAIEETIEEAKERGDLDPDRAKQFLKGALGRAQEAAEGAKRSFDGMREEGFPTVQEALEELKGRVERLERAFRARGPRENRGPDPTQESAEGEEPGREA